jgi:hypothetical protein
MFPESFTSLRNPLAGHRRASDAREEFRPVERLLVGLLAVVVGTGIAVVMPLALLHIR